MTETAPQDSENQGGTPSQRRDPRDSLFVLARIRPEDHSSEEATVRVRNVSSGGLMADAPHGYGPAMRVVVTLDGVGEVAGSVAWAEAGRIGVAFDHPVDKSRARKRSDKPADDLFRPITTDHRRPGVKPR